MNLYRNYHSKRFNLFSIVNYFVLNRFEILSQPHKTCLYQSYYFNGFNDFFSFILVQYGLYTYFIGGFNIKSSKFFTRALGLKSIYELIPFPYIIFSFAIFLAKDSTKSIIPAIWNFEQLYKNISTISLRRSCIILLNA